jgi:predicted O-linked N-acetylglucosamine transferase (SPINDLY family)
MAELLELHDRSRFELVGIDFGPVADDAMRTRVRACFDRFIDVRTLSDREVAQLSRDLAIDIAVDLKGFTEDARPGIFAERAAPVQVSYLGFPGTMGAGYIDYIVADEVVIPAASRPLYSEKVVSLPDSYQVNDRKRRIADGTFTREELGLPADGFVFCCFNNDYKVTPSTFDGWMRILRRVEGSVLWLFEDSAMAATNLHKEAERRGVGAERLVFARRMAPHDHLARYRNADLFLDTLPYNAHTTASDALWAGLPVLTCAGEAFASRVAASLLSAVGLPELITTTPAAFEALAIALASDRARLGRVRATLAANRPTAPLFDTPRFARHIEAAYQEMHERRLAGLPPDHITVAALAHG